MTDILKDVPINEPIAPSQTSISVNRNDIKERLGRYYDNDGKLKPLKRERVKTLDDKLRYGGKNYAVAFKRKDKNELGFYISSPKESKDGEYYENTKDMILIKEVPLPTKYADVKKETFTIKLNTNYAEKEAPPDVLKKGIGEVIVEGAPPEPSPPAPPADDEEKKASQPPPPQEEDDEEEEEFERRRDKFLKEEILEDGRHYIYGPLGIPLPIQNANGSGTSIPEFLTPLVSAKDSTGADILAALEIWKRQGRKMARGAREVLDEEKRAIEEQVKDEEVSGGRVPINPFKNEWKEYFKMIDNGQYEAAASLRQAIYDSDKYKQYRKEVLTNPEKLAEIASNEREANIGATQQQIAEKAHTTTKRYKRMNKKLQDEQNRLQKAAEKAGATLLEIKEEVDKQYANETNEVDKEQVRNAENEHEKRLVARKTADELQYTSTDTPQSQTNPFSMNVFTSTLHGDDYYRMRNNGRSVYNQYTTWNERGSVGDEVSNDEFATKIYKTFYRYQGANIVPNS